MGKAKGEKSPHLSESQGRSGDEVPNRSSITSDLPYRALLDLLPCYISIQDQSMRLLFTNQNFRNDFGEGEGRSCYEVYKGRTEKCELCPVQKAFDDKQVHVSRETVLSDGEESEMVVYAAPIKDVMGNVNAVVEMSISITKVSRIQKELRFLGESIAMLSHDIKNILEGLQGGTYVVDAGFKDKDMDLAFKGWEIVKKNIADISRITQNVLYSSKKRHINLEKVSPAELVSDVAGLFRDKAKSMDIDLLHRANPQLPLVNLEPSSIRRMLNNLIWNALEACRQKKEGKRHVVVVRADFYDRYHFVFEVEDSGVGMDDEARSQIFKGFYSTKGSDATGLGLLVVDRIVKQHEGRIEILTAPGRGTTFRVILKLR